MVYVGTCLWPTWFTESRQVATGPLQGPVFSKPNNQQSMGLIRVQKENLNLLERKVWLSHFADKSERITLVFCTLPVNNRKFENIAMHGLSSVINQHPTLLCLTQGDDLRFHSPKHSQGFTPTPLTYQQHLTTHLIKQISGISPYPPHQLWNTSRMIL